MENIFSNIIVTSIDINNLIQFKYMNTHTGEQEVTIDELAIMINKGFMAVDRRFDEVDKRFEGIDGRIDGIEKTIKDMKRDMATKDDIALLDSHIQATNKIVYKEHAPKI